MKKVRALLLAAGLGTRLRPLTNSCPKCLMPIGGRPLLEHWLCTLLRHKISKVLVNIHHHRDLVESFLTRKQFNDWVFGVYEPRLLGTARTLSENEAFLFIDFMSRWVRFWLHFRYPKIVLNIIYFRNDGGSKASFEALLLYSCLLD